MFLQRRQNASVLYGTAESAPELKKADYIVTGQWAKKRPSAEVRRYPHCRYIRTGCLYLHTELEKRFPARTPIMCISPTIRSTAACSFHPGYQDIVTARSSHSNFLSGSIMPEDFGLIFAGAGKRRSTAGVDRHRIQRRSHRQLSG